MKVRSVKLNFILNSTRLFLGAFFILLTTPYVTRVLGVNNLGKVDYVSSIISYFLLFTALGIPQYGVREIARVRDDKKERTKVVLELGSILFITTLIAYIVLFLMLAYIPSFYKMRKLILIMSIWILSTNIGFEWFYQGIENQLYITIRFIFVRFLAILLMFFFVKNQGDYIKYGIIIVIMNSGSNLLNLINLKKYLSLKEITRKNLNITRHIKYILVIFAASLSVSIYLQLDVVMLGAIKPETVALYTVPNKLIRLTIIMVTALGTVLLPRISNSLKNGDMEMYRKYMNYSIKYIFMLSFPLIVGIFLLSKEIILLMAGEKFVSAILTMRLLSIIILVVGVAYFLGFQLLYPLGLEKYYTYSVITAAVINFIFNYIMIPRYFQNGAAIGTIIAELVGIVMMLYFGKKHLKEIVFFNRGNLKYFGASIGMGIVIIIIKDLDLNVINTILLSVILGGISYGAILLLLLKEQIMMDGLKLIRNKIQKRK